MSNRQQIINEALLRVDGVLPGSKHDKHLKMCISPFVFYRGSSQLFYHDIQAGLLDLPESSSVPLTTIMGDCHTSNFGFFTEEGSFGEQIVFSLNDFDDACVGHAIWDISRLMVSLVLAVEHCRGVVDGYYLAEKDYSDKKAVGNEQMYAALNAMLDAYMLVLEQGLSKKAIDQHFLDLAFNDFATPSALSKRYKKAKKIVLGGEAFLSKSALAKAVDLQTYPLKFKADSDKFLPLVDGKYLATKQAIAPYFFHEILDIVARLGSGTGSAGLERYYALVGPSELTEIEHLALCHVVEIKQQREAAPIYYFPNLHHQNKLNPAHLTVKCQRRMQRRTDFILDEAYFDDRHWLLRSRHHAKVGMDPEHIGIGKVNAEQGGFAFYASACGQELARAHCRGDRFSLDYERAQLAYLQKQKTRLIDLATMYAKQVMQDWRYLCEREKT
ncbi:DUF2252 family protein [Agaribacter flavus]|uniref:DUF2252 family protein n=1 Tax=Agaribacter flavus TaxID=1902781 RepID=A0ABV7FS58_9ALTE